MTTVAPHISKEIFVKILQEDKLLQQQDLSIFQTIYSHDKHEASATDIAKRIGLTDKVVINSKIGRLGKRISKKYNIKPREREDGSKSFWDFFFTGYWKGTFFIWKLKPELMEALEECGMVEKVKQDSIQKTGHMTSWIQYHNCDLQKCYPSGLPLDNVDTEKIDIPSIEKERGGIYTKKRKAAYDSVGNEIFLIIGLGKPKKYYLWSKILVDIVIPKDNGFFIVEGNCSYPQNPISIDTLVDFNDFRQFCGNFGIGLQNITKHQFSKTLGSFFEDSIVLETLDDYIDNVDNSIDLIHAINNKMKDIHPSKVNRLIETTIRNDSKIVKLLKEINNYTCQYPGCNTQLLKKNGDYYIEVAHIKAIAKGGQSIIGNLLVLCPNHHKLFDYGDLQIKEQTEHLLMGFLNNEQFEIRIKDGA